MEQGLTLSNWIQILVPTGTILVAIAGMWIRSEIRHARTEERVRNLLEGREREAVRQTERRVKVDAQFNEQHGMINNLVASVSRVEGRIEGIADSLAILRASASSAGDD